MVLMRKSGLKGIKRYSFTESGDAPRDISGITLSNGRGKLMAQENYMGLPVISWMCAPINTCQQVIAGQNMYTVNYKNDVFFHPKYCPMGPLLFEDGMQPVVTDGDKVYWCMDMKAVSRRLIDNVHVVETVTEGEHFRLTTTDFAAFDKDVLYRVFKLTNTSGESRSFKLTHYLPINAFGKTARINDPNFKENWRYQKPYNEARYDAESSALVFTANAPESEYEVITTRADRTVPAWVVMANRAADEFDCAEKPDVMDRIDEGVSGCRNANGIVDSQMSFTACDLKPGEDFEVTFAIIPTEDANVSLESLRKDVLPIGCDPDVLIRAALDGWKSWLSLGNIANIKDEKIRGFVTRMLSFIKTCIREDGLPAADGCGYAEYFTRDVLKPIRAFAAFGFYDDARSILLSLAAEISKKGIINNCNKTVGVKEAVEKGFDDVKISRTEKCTPDCPQEFLLAVADYFGRCPEDKETLIKLYPVIRYVAEIGEQYMGDNGLVISDEAVNDDFLQWSFWRSSEREFKQGRPGLACCYFNMEWVSSLEKIAELADGMGKREDANKWREQAKSIRSSIEKKFWSDELSSYAYFHDPKPIDQYGTPGSNNPQITYIGVRDNDGGMLVFPDPPLIHGQTVPILAGYSKDERAMLAYRTAKEATGEPRDSFSLLKERADCASIYFQYIQAMALLGDPDAEKGIEWIIRETPLAGAPERFPTNRSGALCWCSADAALAMYYYLYKKGDGGPF